MLQFPCYGWFSIGTVSWKSDGYTGPLGFFFSSCQVSNVASFLVLLTHSLASCGRYQLCSSGWLRGSTLLLLLSQFPLTLTSDLYFFSIIATKKFSASRAVFTFDCGKFLLQWGLDSLFLSVCKLHYVKVIAFILRENFIRLFRGAAQFSENTDVPLTG